MRAVLKLVLLLVIAAVISAATVVGIVYIAYRILVGFVGG